MRNNIIQLILLTLITAQGIVGEYKLVGLNVVDYDFCRQNTDIKVVEKSGFSLDSLTVYTIQQGENIDYDVREPYRGSGYLRGAHQNDPLNKSPINPDRILHDSWAREPTTGPQWVLIND